jgi:hypothetical protein
MAHLIVTHPVDNILIEDVEHCPWLWKDKRKTYAVCVGANGMPDEVTEMFVKHGYRVGKPAFLEIL